MEAAIVLTIVTFITFFYNFISYHECVVSRFDTLQEQDETKKRKEKYKMYFEISGIIFIISLMTVVTI